VAIAPTSLLAIGSFAGAVEPLACNRGRGRYGPNGRCGIEKLRMKPPARTCQWHCSTNRESANPSRITDGRLQPRFVPLSPPSD